ncbi:MAG: hypothetical protein PVG49_09260 [Desulfobacteraceae bacterium]|jgi:hypothetical protein
MITLTTAGSHPNAPLQIDPGPNTDLGTVTVRVSRSATLDGGASITHLGCSAGDRTMRVEWPEITDDEREILRSWIRTQTRFVLTCREGAFLGSIEKARVDKDPVRFTFLVVSAEVEA